MSNSKSTPGPWAVNTNKYYDNGKPGIIWGPKGPRHGAICNMNKEYPNNFNEANARLIAAAPDLLEACKAQHEAIDKLFALLISKIEGYFPSKSGQPWEAILQGNAAITKAEEGN